MAFLLEAIRRNATKISLTVLLCLVVLYIFAAISYTVFLNMYGFDVSTKRKGRNHNPLVEWKGRTCMASM
jgi:hypothetical protein